VPRLKPVDTDDIDALVARVRGRMDEGTLSAARWAIAHPGQARSLLHWLRGLPRTTITPSGDRAGAVLRKRFGGIGLLGTGRHAQAALVLPPTVEEYWRGPKRKVFRNKMAGAARNGFSWRMLAPEETAGAVQAVCDQLGWGRDARADMDDLLELPLESALASAVFSPDGSVLSVCLAVASGDAAQVRWGMSVGKGPARWAAFAALLEGAHARGITTILVGPMMGRESEDEYFQRRLGFEPSNIVVAPDVAPAPVPAVTGASTLGRQAARARRWVGQVSGRRNGEAPTSGWSGQGTGRGPTVVLALLVGAAALATTLSS
jgi:hypothetical protein